MLDFFDIPDSTTADIQIFGPNSATGQTNFSVWNKRRGASMCAMYLLGGGGAGGTGVVGANSAAAGGGGGGSSGQTYIVVPAFLLPDVLFVQVGMGQLGGAGASRVCITPNSTANNVVAIANGGSQGGNGAGAVGGTAGAAGGAATAATMPLGWAFVTSGGALAGQAGIAGGTTGAGANLTLPVTGLRVTGGTGGGGLPATAVAGTAGGSINAAGVFPLAPGGIGGATATLAPGLGVSGVNHAFNGLRFSYGGTGGGSTHGSATGAGLVAAFGGTGGVGSGGGGGGGAFTGSTVATGGPGGQGIVIIATW